MNHDLPFAFAQIPPGFRVLHDRQTPLLELVHRGIDVAGDIVTQVFAHETHEVVAGITDMILGLVLVPLHAHIAVDCIQTLRDRAAALDVRLFDADNLQVPPPVPGFVSSATAGHAAADNENIRIDENRLASTKQPHLDHPLLELIGSQCGQSVRDIKRFRLVRKLLGFHGLLDRRRVVGG